jgi:hypothetical protein
MVPLYEEIDARGSQNSSRLWLLTSNPTSGSPSKRAPRETSLGGRGDPAPIGCALRIRGEARSTHTRRLAATPKARPRRRLSSSTSGAAFCGPRPRKLDLASPPWRPPFRHGCADQRDHALSVPGLAPTEEPNSHAFLQAKTPSGPSFVPSGRVANPDPDQEQAIPTSLGAGPVHFALNRHQQRRQRSRSHAPAPPRATPPPSSRRAHPLRLPRRAGGLLDRPRASPPTGSTCSPQHGHLRRRAARGNRGARALARGAPTCSSPLFRAGLQASCASGARISLPRASRSSCSAGPTGCSTWASSRRPSHHRAFSRRAGRLLPVLYLGHRTPPDVSEALDASSPRSGAGHAVTANHSTVRQDPISTCSSIGRRQARPPVAQRVAIRPGWCSRGPSTA